MYHAIPVTYRLGFCSILYICSFTVCYTGCKHEEEEKGDEGHSKVWGPGGGRGRGRPHSPVALLLFIVILSCDKDPRKVNAAALYDLYDCNPREQFTLESTSQSVSQSSSALRNQAREGGREGERAEGRKLGGVKAGPGLVFMS